MVAPTSVFLSGRLGQEPGGLQSTRNPTESGTRTEDYTTKNSVSGKDIIGSFYLYSLPFRISTTGFRSVGFLFWNITCVPQCTQTPKL